MNICGNVVVFIMFWATESNYWATAAGIAELPSESDWNTLVTRICIWICIRIPRNWDASQHAIPK
ncbi:hypothetical protein FOZ60_005895 [Perkinsus olseni]|uniref:Uncharacterized protein n=1 Tax=Perkinsus olseni TaxID=32597 RepID=A0A7J6NSE2_PEROL|nr:hypothetical protein FOZ60_005895 [Perkinsus olseni]